MHEEVKQIRQRQQSATVRERLYFWLLLLSTLVTGCGLIIGILTLETIGIIIVGTILLLLGMFWVRQWIRVMTIRTDGMVLSEQQQPLDL